MELCELPFFDERHRMLAARASKLCTDRLVPLSTTEIEDARSSAVEYVALLGQEELFDPALGRALEGEAPRPDLRALVLVRELLGNVSGLCDAAYGAQIQGMFPIALSGNEDQRAIHLPGMMAGQSLVGLALLDGDEGPAVLKKTADGYVLSGSKAMVPLAPVADRFVVLARHGEDGPARFSLVIVEATAASIESEEFISSLPVGKMVLDAVELDEDARLGGEGQGLVITQATLDMFRLPTAAACVGIGSQVIRRGMREILQRGVGGRRLADQQGLLWALGDAHARVEAARAVVAQAVWRRDTSTQRDAGGTAIARQLAQDAAESAVNLVADLIGLRGLRTSAPWERMAAEVRALRLETEFLENARSIIGQSLVASIEGKK
jgi:acyl-CoA dehydrogenase